VYKRFEHDIHRMNKTCQLAPVSPDSWHAMDTRLEQFKEILDKEFVELEDIQVELNRAADDNREEILHRVRVALADLLGDIIVYCASEGVRWELPMPQVLEVIMASNFSKLGADGLPIKNPKTDKFEKGPNYWKPEPLISEVLKGANIQFGLDGAANISYGDERLKLDMDAVTSAATAPAPPAER